MINNSKSYLEHFFQYIKQHVSNIIQESNNDATILPINNILYLENNKSYKPYVMVNNIKITNNTIATDNNNIQFTFYVYICYDCNNYNLIFNTSDFFAKTFTKDFNFSPNEYYSVKNIEQDISEGCTKLKFLVNGYNK